jgi:hypothetical protein
MYSITEIKEVHTGNITEWCGVNKQGVIMTLMNGDRIIAQKDCPLASYYVVGYGSLDQLRQFNDLRCLIDTTTCEFAAKHNKLAHLKLINEIKPKLLTISVVNTASENGNVECLEYLLSIGCSFGISTVNAAVKNGQLECLKVLVDHDRKVFKRSSCLVSRDRKLGLSSTLIAAENGHLKCLVYLFNAGFALNYQVEQIARDNGHGDCADFLFGVCQAQEC